MKTIKKILLQWLGHKRYLQLTSSFFFTARNQNWLRNQPAYYAHYLALEFINPGDTVIDIGANLGYYARPFAKKVGANGKVLAVEPIALYREVLEHNVAGLTQVTILPFALGETEGTIQMGNPSEDKHRHGLMRVLKEDEAKANTEVYEVAVKNPMQLFGSLEKVDYIKCDIEGYEVPVIPAMRPLIEKLRPIMQVETEGDNKKVLMGLFKDVNYVTFFAGKDELVPYPDATQHLRGDLIAIPAEKVKKFDSFISHAR
jgi:FkbM family methyltransferase